MSVKKIERREAPRWVIDIRYVDGRTGRRVRHRRDATVQTSSAAHAEERRLLVELAGRGYIPTDAERRTEASKQEGTEVATFREAVLSFRKTKAQAQLKRTTRVIYDVWLDVELLPRFGEKKLTDLGYLAAESLDAELAQRELRPATRRNIAIVLRSVLRHAVATGLLGEMPKLPPLPKVGQTTVRPPSAEDVERVLAEVDPFARRALVLAADAGLRAGEIRGLEWQDVDLDTGLIRIRQAIYYGEPDSPKSGHEREVPMTARLKALLTEASRKRHRATDPVAPTKYGTVWANGSLMQVFRRALARLGLPLHRLHDLRHLFVTRCFRAGVDVRTVQELAGHHHLSVTARYAHTNAEAKRQAIAALDRVGPVGQQMGNS